MKTFLLICVAVTILSSVTALRLQHQQSWDSYIDNLIAQTKSADGSAHADKAAIIGLDGGAM